MLLRTTGIDRQAGRKGVDQREGRRSASPRRGRSRSRSPAARPGARIACRGTRRRRGPLRSAQGAADSRSPSGRSARGGWRAPASRRSRPARRSGSTQGAGAVSAQSRRARRRYGAWMASVQKQTAKVARSQTRREFAVPRGATRATTRVYMRRRLVPAGKRRSTRLRANAIVRHAALA